MLVHRYERELFNYLRRYLGDATLAEDVFQSTFLQVHLKLDLYERGRRVRPWLYTIATHQAIDALRKKNRHTAASIDVQVPSGEGTANTYADLIAAPMPDTDSLVESEERIRARELLKRLTREQREAIILVYYQGMKYKDAAAVAGVAIGTLKSRIHQGVNVLTRLAKAS